MRHVPRADNGPLTDSTHEAVERLVAFVLILVLATCLSCITLALVGAFQPWLVWCAVVSFSILGLTLLHRALGGSRIAFVHYGRAAVLLAVSGTVLFFTFKKPGEWLTNHHMDAGRYANIASFLLERGTLELENTLPPFTDNLDAQQELSDFPGMFRTPERPARKYIGPYLHLYPSVLAFFRSHIGIYHSLKLNWLLAIGGASVLYLLVVQLTGSRLSAFLVAGFVFTNPACQLLFNRNLSETLAMFLVFSTFFFLTVLDKRPTYAVALLAATTLFLLAMCRVEFGILYPLIPLIFSLIFLVERRRPSQAFLLFLLAHLLYLLPLGWYYEHDAFVYVVGNSRKALRIFWQPFVSSFQDIRPQFVRIWLGADALLLTLNLAFVRYFLKEARGDSKIPSIRWPYLLVGSYCAFLIWNLVIRPFGGPPADSSYAKGFNHDAVNLVKLLYFQDIVTLILSPLGVYVLLTKTRQRAFGIFVIIFSCLLLVKSNHSPPALWWIRRFVPVSIPGFYFLAVLGLMSLKHSKLRAAAISVVFAFNLGATALTVRAITEREGLHNFYVELSNVFENNTVQLCFDGDGCNHAAVPLHAHFGVPTVYLRRGITEGKLEFFKRVLESGRTLLITHTALTDAPFSEAEVLQLKEAGLELSLLSRRFYQAPDLKALGTLSGFEHWTSMYFPRTFLPPNIGTTEFNVSLWKLTEARAGK